MKRRFRFWTEIWALIGKDVISEWRSREISLSAFIFSVLAMLIFSFAFGPGMSDLQSASSGALWLVFIFAAILILNGSFATEREEGGLEGVLMTPIDRSVLYFGKTTANLIFMFLVEAVVLAFVYQVLFSSIQPEKFLTLIFVIFLGTVGVISVGTLFSAISANSRMREMMLPILLLPVIVPVLIASVKATDVILGGKGFGATLPWIKILVPFDIIYVSISSLVFEYVAEE